MRNGVLLELDRQDIGGVTRKALERFAGKRTLKICIEDLRLQYDANDSTPVSPTIPSNDLVPTLVWTDDEVENIKEGLDHATSRGIRVIQLPSTATTKLWIEQNEDEIRALEKCNLIQFITDNVRWEVNDQNDNGLGHVAKGPSLNLSAGESVLRYLRGRGFKAPVLVYCGGSLRLTHYVMAYSRAASTCFDEICDAFIDRLVEARADRAKEEKRLVYDDEYDEFWAGYRKMEGYNLEPSF
ncbi:hypothetical protein AX15_007852 [Amanita polypyramis BW_CC]|nr:hypothetical protein AX15_007852 [Amanita polypyramis BW_CC]